MNAIPSPRPVRFSTRGRGSTLRKKPRPRRRPPRPRRRPRDAQARRSASHSYTTSRRRRCRHPRTRCPRSPIRRAARRRRCRASARAARASRPWTLRPPCASLSTASPSCAYWTLPTPRTSRRARRTGARSPREDDNCRSASSRAASSRRVAATPRRHCKDAETSVQMTRVATPRPQTGSPHQHVKKKPQVADSFRGAKPLARHRKVMGALKHLIDSGAIHSVQVKAVPTPVQVVG